METRRGNSGIFNIEIKKSPHVLDLRRHSVTREIILRELAGIESHDMELAVSLGIPLTFEETIFPQDKQQKAFELIPPRRKDTSSSLGVRTIRSFAFFAGSIAVMLLGSFFFQKGLDLKNEGVAQSMDAYYNLRDAEIALKNLDFEGASSDFAKAYENLASAEGTLEEIGGLTISIVENIPLDSRPASSIALLRAAKHVARAGEMISSALWALSPDGALSVKGYLAVLVPTPGSKRPQELLPMLGVFEEALVRVEEELARAQYEVVRVDPDDFPDEFRGSIRGLAQKIPALLTVTQALKEYSRISSLLLGEDSPKRYLILFQNSSELRPTGGFIGSYAVVSVEGGKLKDMFVDGIYNADGQLTVNVVPPKPLQHVTTAWSTHDANWFLDFPSSAEKILWFYEQTGGGKVDGVATLNVEVIERLLALTGPIALPRYELTLDSQNFRDEIQYEVEVAYEKKLNRPKQVLADFTPLFLERLSQVAEKAHTELASLVLTALDQKYMMFYFKDADTQEFFENQGWSGNIHKDLPPASPEIQRGEKGDKLSQDDYLAVAHTNIGGHKTDKFMDDEINYDVAIQEDGSILGRVTVTRTHRGGDSKYWWYNRPNFDYIKIYVPQGSRVVSYAGGERREVENPADYTALQFSEDPDVSAIESRAKREGPVDVLSESGHTVFGTWLVTKAKSTSVFKLEYELPFRVEFKNGAGKYNLYFQKQPGTMVSGEVNVDVPDSMEIAWDNSETNAPNHSFTLDKDKVFGYILRR